MASTTIRVPQELRDRLAERASARSTSLADEIAHALDALDEADFWGRVRATMATPQARARLIELAESVGSASKDGLDETDEWADLL